MMDSSPTRNKNGDAERGSSFVSTTLGLLFFIMFLLFACQILIGLYARTSITAAGYDAARIAASTGDYGAATARFNALRGNYDAQITFSSDGQNVIADIDGTNPTFLPASFNGAMAITSVNRRIIVRIEEFQDE